MKTIKTTKELQKELQKEICELGKCMRDYERNYTSSWEDVEDDPAYEEMMGEMDDMETELERLIDG